MTLPEYLRLLRERWVPIVAALILGLVVAYAFTAVSPALYAASATMYISSEEDPTGNSSAYESSQLAKDRVESYTELITSDRISRDVVSDLNLTMSSEELADRISASAGAETVLVTATVVDRSPEDAARIANGVAAAFVRLVAEIEQPSDPTRRPPLVARIVEPAAAPSAPVSPRPLVNYSVGALAGLLIGFAGVALRYFTDTTIRTRQQLTDAAGVPALGAVAYDKRARRGRLAMRDRPQSPRAEEFRALRTNLQAMESTPRGRVIVVTSSVRGEGKSVVVSNLAMALADAGRRVIVVDANLRQPAMSSYLGVRPASGLTDVVLGSAKVQSVVQRCLSDGGAFDLLDTGLLPPHPSELLGSPTMALLIAFLRERYEYVLLDTPALLPVTDAAAVAHRADGVVLVTRYGRTRSRDVCAAVGALQAARVRLLGTVLNMVPEVHGLLRRESPARKWRYSALYAADRTPDRSDQSVVSGQPTPPPPHGEPAVVLPPPSRSSAPAGSASRNGINGPADGTNGAYLGDLAEPSPRPRAGRETGPDDDTRP